MKTILAVVTLDKESLAGGGAPVFVTSSREEQQKVAFKLEKILDAMAHDLENGSMIIVKH